MSLDDLPLLDIRRFPVECGHILQFARAIGDPNPIYVDPDYAAATPLGGIIAPPTFTEAGLHFDAGFAFRPRVGERWWGSARLPANGTSPVAGGGTSFHAATHFEYHQALRPGMTLHGVTRHGRTWEKHGKRSGRLAFRETLTDYLDQNDRLLVTCTTVGVSTEHTVEQATTSAPAPDRAWRLPDLPMHYPARPPRARDLSPGAGIETLLADDLARAQILLYAGASGDFSPQHTDEVYNTRAAGYPSVFAHGMLTMGMTGRMLTDWLGDGRLTRFGVNFLRQVWPGDTLIARARVAAVRAEGDQPHVDLEVTTVNQHDEAVVAGHASARVDP
ncbi:MAG: MaoC/PaaZ C-terminal domain-containing protein [Gammaproteobacteria bacterium]